MTYALLLFHNWLCFSSPPNRQIYLIYLSQKSLSHIAYFKIGFVFSNSFGFVGTDLSGVLLSDWFPLGVNCFAKLARIILFNFSSFCHAE